MNRTFSKSVSPQAAGQKKTRKVLVSFLSPDQDSWEFKKRDPTFMGSFAGEPKNRNEIWRPSVALAQLKGLSFDEYYLLWDGAAKQAPLIEQVKKDINKVIKDLGRNTKLTVSDLKISKPFETSDVYPKLYNYLSQHEFQRSDTEYYVNCTNGTTQMRNCLVLLPHTGRIKACRIAPTPWKDYRIRDRRCVEGSYATEDPSVFGKAYEDIDKKRTSNKVLRLLLQGVITKDATKLKDIAHVLEEIMAIKDDNFRAKQVILITGETGVGKTQLAENIAAAFGGNEKKKFIALNCATLRGADPNLPRIELFGCKKGAATGLQERTGAFKDADGGILFLDEIGELSLEMQAMLLTALDKGTFIPLGGTAKFPEQSHFQLICGTNRPLEESIKEGKFRIDLFNRINTWHFELEPLRTRRSDITDNLKAQVSDIGKKCGKDNFEIQKDAEDLFREFAEDEDSPVTWDGNFRELNAMITRMVVRSKGERIEKKIVEEEIAEALRRYSAKANPETGKAQPDVPVGNPSENRVEATPPAVDARSVIGPDAYDELSLVEQAELDLLVKTITNDLVVSQQALCQKVYGDKLTPGGLSRRLKSQFKLRFAHGRLTPVQEERDR